MANEALSIDRVVNAPPRIGRLVARRGIATLLAVCALFVFFSITARGFLSFDNMIEITRLFSLWCIVGVGETLLLIGKEVDLSVGSHYAFLVVVLGFLAGTNSWDPWLA